MPRHGVERGCGHTPLRLDPTDASGWHEVCRLRAPPERLEQAYRQRLHPHGQAPAHQGLETQMGKLRRGRARLLDRETAGLIDKQACAPRVTRRRTRVQHLEAQGAPRKAAGEVEGEVRCMLGRLNTFAATVHEGLHQADFQTRQEIIRSLVKRVDVEQQHIRIVCRISPTSFPSASDNTYWPDSGKRLDPRALHRHNRALRFIEPGTQGEQRGVSRGKFADVLRDLAILVHLTQAGRQACLMDINTATGRVNDLHRLSLQSLDKRR
jgi:site-specific DNA recombinase